MDLTQAVVDRLTLPVGKSELRVFDSSRGAPTGFGIRLRGDRRSFIVQYREKGTSKTRLIANVADVSLEQARILARAYNAQLLLHGDPNAAKAAAIEAAKIARLESAKNLITVGATYETFLWHLEKHGRSAKHVADTRRYLRVAWKPLHGMRVDAISRKDVAGQLGKITAASGAISGNRARIALSSFFKWALGEGLADLNPVAGTNRPAQEVARDRVLSDEEIRTVWLACEDDDFGRMIRLLILTACRREEVGSATWSEFDLARDLWTIPGARTKNGRPHEVPLTPEIRTILDAVGKRDGRDIIFGAGQNGYGGWSKSKKTLDERITAMRKEAGFSKPALPHWRVHDLRRTGATRMGDLGVLPHVVEAVLNHVSGTKAGVAGVYNKALYRSEKQAALKQWSRHVSAIVAKKEANEANRPGATA